MEGAYLGPSFDNNEIKDALDRLGAVYHNTPADELLKIIAAAISSEKVIGWFQGRMEFGPRALGNRSILGDARSEKMQSMMNLKIKFRESFRPFAPSVMEEKSTEYFDIDRPSPYMLLTAQVKSGKLVKADTDGKTGMELLKLKRSVVPAITHVDNSARLQTVSEKTNPLFYKLLKEFESKTGCPLIINTSFNVRGEPIICNPVDAYNCFMGTGIDLLAIGDFILYKEEQPKNPELKKWKKSLIKD